MAKKITVKQALDSLNEKYAKTLVMLDDALDVIEDLETQLEAKSRRCKLRSKKLFKLLRRSKSLKETVVNEV